MLNTLIASEILSVSHFSIAWRDHERFQRGWYLASPLAARFISYYNGEIKISWVPEGS